MKFFTIQSTKNRPKLKIETNNFDILLEVIAIVILVYLWYLTYMNYQTLPEQIATHFNASGKVDEYGSKSTILLLPIIATGMYVLMTIINKFPHTFNYLTEITKENAYRQYKLATQMIRFLKANIIVIFTLITHFIIRDAKSDSSSMGTWFLPVFLGLTFIPIIAYMVQMIRKK